MVEVEPTQAVLPLTQASLAPVGRSELARMLSPHARRLQGSVPREEVSPLIDAAAATYRNLYALGRSDEALPLAASVLAQARRLGDPVLVWRSLTDCGILSADAFDIVGSLELHQQALKIAVDARNAVNQGLSWNNIGIALALAGSPGMAARAYRRALQSLESHGQHVHARYAACTNLANSLFHLGEFEEGLLFAARALLEMTPEFAQRDPHAAILLRRNLVNLTVATGRIEEAAAHVEILADLTDGSPSPRAFIAAATGRAVFELAIGQHDIALTRLDQALSKARQTPPALRDTLVCVIRAEEAAGYPERALARLQELSEHVYRFAIERALRHIELADLAEGLNASERAYQQTRARLADRVERPDAPAGWEALRRLAASAALRMDATGLHGVRVGALAQSLALECGEPPLQALEIGLAAQLHDIGLVSVPEGILAKRGALNPVEQAAYLRHTDAGADILRDDRHPRVQMAREMARYHHARWDGTGYPDKVGGRHIPLAARICAVADAYDERVCGLRSPKAANMSEALAGLARAAGGELDADLVAHLECAVRKETANYGIDPAAPSGLEDFHELITLLQEDRGFV
jgi:putative two-component system response regulator